MELLRKVWVFLKALFWFDRLDRLAQEKRWFVFKILPWFARFFLFGYLFAVLVTTSQLIMGRSLELLVIWLLSLVFFPVAYRIVMGVQIWFHSLISG